jgi:dihydrofolate synthase/folylpolyglutamate synthase
MRPGLERIEALLDALDHPEARYRLVQVAGTNGKGSVAATLATMLKASGRRVGLYTSPHLVSFRERIRIDGEAISEDGVVDGVEALGTLVARFDATMFEATTALALDHFARERVEIAVLEVGLGGRLDSTTVGTPLATVITRIDLDHQAWLGSTLAAIAMEKAAIIRSGVRVAISAAQEPEAGSVIARRAADTGVPLLVEGRDLHVAVKSRSLDGQRIDCTGPGWRLDDLRLSMLGTFQPGNALLAVAAARELGVPESAIRAGVERVAWPGRVQVVGRDPWIVLDAAHNPAGATALAASLDEMFPGRAITLVIGVLRDKDARGILGALAPRARRIILTRFSSPRSADPRELAALLPAGSSAAETAESIKDALTRAVGADGTSVVCVAGSVALLGDAMRELSGGRDKPCSIEKGTASMDLRL